MKKIILSFAQRVAVHDELKKVCKTGSDGFAMYSTGWDDERVAAVVGPPVTHTHVASVRREMFGRVRGHGGASGDAGLASRIEAIEDYLTSKWPDWREHVGEGKLL